MPEHIATFRGITYEPELFVRLMDKMLSDCGKHFYFEDDLTGTDTLILGNAPKAARLVDPRPTILDWKSKEFPLLGDVFEDPDRLEYEPEHFWGVYRRIADKFLETFDNLPLEELPFGVWARRKFVTAVWMSFFELETSNFIAYDRKFAILALRTISYPDKYLDSTNELERIVMRRYRIPFD